MTIYDPFYGHYLPESPEPPKKSKKETFDEQLRRTLPNWLAERHKRLQRLHDISEQSNE